MRRILPLVTAVAGACSHSVETRAAPAPHAPVDAGAKIAAASTAWLAGDLDTAEKLLAGAGNDPHALALLARAYAIAGKPGDAARVVARLASAKIEIATETSRITRAVLSPDGAYVATFGDSPRYHEDTVTVWSTITGRDLFTLDATSASFGIDPKTHETRVVAFVTHAETQLRAYDAATGTPRWTAQSRHRVYDVAIDRQGTLTALTDDHASLEQHDLATGALRREIPTDSNAAVLQISDDSTTAIAAGTVIDLPAKGTRGTKLLDAPRSPLLAPDGRTFATSLPNGDVAITDREGRPRHTIAHPGDDLQFLDDGTLLAFDKIHVKRFDALGKLLAEFDLPVGLQPVGFRSFVTGRSGHLLARRGAELVVVALASGHPAIISTFGGATRATALAWSADGAKLGLASANEVQTVWTPAGATIVELKSRFFGPLSTLAFDATGKLTTDAPDNEPQGARIFVRDPDGTAVRFVEADEGLVAFARAGATLVGAGKSGKVHVWNAETGQGLGEVGRAGERVTALALRPDGKLLAIARRHGEVELWDLPSRTQVLAITAGAPAAAVAPDGRFEGNPHGLVRRAGAVDVPILPGDAPSAGLAAAVLAKPPAQISIAPTPAAKLAPRGCVPADESNLQATMTKLDGDTLSYCLKPLDEDPYCFSGNLASGVVPAPAPIAAIAPPNEARAWMPFEATPAGLRVCVRSGTCRDLALQIDPQHQPIAASDDGALFAIDREGNGQVEVLDMATTRRVARFKVHYGTPKQTERGAHELGFLGHSVLATSVPCAGPCGEATIYDLRGKKLGELGVEASQFGAQRFHDDLYVLHSIDEAFVVQDAATGKIVIHDEVPRWDVALTPTRMVRISGMSSDATGGTIQIYDAAARPVARLETPRCPATN